MAAAQPGPTVPHGSMLTLLNGVIAFTYTACMHASNHPAFLNYSWLAFRIASQARPALFSNHIQSRWHADASVFGRRTMLDLVDFIDAHLHTALLLSQMASNAGLSPSHFAKKFRQSTGLSLHRFINLRRVQRALDTLKANGESLDVAAHDLGFCSQSHFTREFRRLTGMTPGRYRKQFKRTVG